MIDLTNIYQPIEQENGDIILKKYSIDTSLYNVKQQNDDYILEKKKITKIDNIQDLMKYEFKNSLILKCYIENKEVNKKKYNCILRHIYKIIDDGAKIIKNTKLNIKTVKKQNEGFYYLESLGISVQRVDSKKCLLEILNQCISNNINIQMEIEMHNDDVINMVQIEL